MLLFCVSYILLFWCNFRMFLRYQVFQVFVMFSALALAVSDSLSKRKNIRQWMTKTIMYQKKFKELKNNCGHVTTTSPTVVSDHVTTTSSPTFNMVVVFGCYRGGKCNGSHACCDCEMTQIDCDSPASWSGRCGSICA